MPRRNPDDLAPVPTDDRRALLVGCALWLAALLTLSAAGDTVDRAGNGWWRWVCVAGLVFGLLATGYLHASRRHTSGGDDPGASVHDQA